MYYVCMYVCVCAQMGVCTCTHLYAEVKNLSSAHMETGSLAGLEEEGGREWWWWVGDGLWGHLVGAVPDLKEAQWGE